MSKAASIVTAATHVLHAQADLGEGAVWNPVDGRLYWVDIIGEALHIYDPETGEDLVAPLGSIVGTVVPLRNGDVLLAMQNGIHQRDGITGALRLLLPPLTDPRIRFNEGKCDPSGRFWVGSMALNAAPGAGSLYRYDGDGTLHTALQGVSISNGIVWTADERTMYYIDTPTRCVQAFDYDAASGNITNGRIAFRIEGAEGNPDGMTMDAEGKLWIAMWGAGRVDRYDGETGALLHTITVPAPHTASCAFGGPDLATLYITTARVELSEEELVQYPLSGDLFAAVPGVKGIPANCYKPLTDA